MRYKNGFGTLKVESIADLKYGEYMCTQCQKVIEKQEDVIPNDRGQSITKHSIIFCSKRCRKENRNAYDRIMCSIFK